MVCLVINKTALEVDFGSKILYCTGKWNPCQQCAGPDAQPIELHPPPNQCSNRFMHRYEKRIVCTIFSRKIYLCAWRSSPISSRDADFVSSHCTLFSPLWKLSRVKQKILYKTFKLTKAAHSMIISMGCISEHWPRRRITLQCSNSLPRGVKETKQTIFIISAKNNLYAVQGKDRIRGPIKHWKNYVKNKAALKSNETQ